MTVIKITYGFLLVIVTLLRAAGQQPVLLGPNVISTEDDEFGATFSPDGKTCFFTKRTPATIISSTYVICYSRWINGQWSEPALAPFSGQYKDFSPFIAPDGSRLFLSTSMPVPAGRDSIAANGQRAGTKRRKR